MTFIDCFSFSFSHTRRLKQTTNEWTKVWTIVIGRTFSIKAFQPPPLSSCRPMNNKRWEIRSTASSFYWVPVDFSIFVLVLIVCPLSLLLPHAIPADSTNPVGSVCTWNWAFYFIYLPPPLSSLLSYHLHHEMTDETCFGLRISRLIESTTTQFIWSRIVVRRGNRKKRRNPFEKWPERRMCCWFKYGAGSYFLVLVSWWRLRWVMYCVGKHCGRRWTRYRCVSLTKHGN